MPPKRRFWKTKQQVGRVFSRYFSRVWVLDLGYECSQNHSKRHARPAVSFSKIFVWGAYILDKSPKVSTTNPGQTVTRSPQTKILEGLTKMRAVYSRSGCDYSIWATNHWKINRTSGFHLLFHLPKSSFDEHEVGTNILILWFRQTHRQFILISSCDFERHIIMISPSCDS